LEFLLEALGYIIVEIILGAVLLYPGVLVLWLFYRGNKSLTFIKEKERTKCFVVSLSLLFLGLLLFI
jgi:hypothetical protein